MAGVSDFNSIEARGDQRLQSLMAACIPGVRPYRERSSFVRNGDRVNERKLVLRYECRTGSTEIPRERVPKIVDDSTSHQRARDVRASERSPGRLLQHFGECDWYPEGVQLLDDALATGVSHRAELGQPLLEPLQSRQVQREKMDLMVVEKRAQLHRRNDSDAEPIAGFSRGEHAIDRIVVSERDRAQPAPGRCFDYTLGWKYPIRSGGVSMQVDEPRPPRRCGHFS